MASFTDEEYQPINGSTMEPRKRNAYITGGVTAFALLGAFAYMSSGGSVASAVQTTQAAAVSAADAVVAVAAPAVEAVSTAATNAVSAATTAAVAEPAATTAAVQVVAEPAVAQTLPAVAAAAADALSAGQWSLVYNSLSFAIAAMGAATVFFFFQFSMVNKEFKTAMVISGLVTLIAFYHYVRIFNSWNDAYTMANGVVTETGLPFNDAYRYVDWLLTVPLLLMELILVMSLSPEETSAQCTKLGSLAALMIVLGYPGEIADSMATRQMWWVAAMIPFVMIVQSLYVGLSDAVAAQPKEAQSLVSQARFITVASWSFYPAVYLAPIMGVSGAQSKVLIQVGYSLADVIAKPIMGLLCWRIAALKSGISH